MTEIKTFWENGAMREKYILDENNKLHGKKIVYHNNGKIYFSCDYHHGEKNGECWYYFENGNPKSFAEYKYDIQNGIYREFDENNKIIKECYIISSVFWDSQTIDLKSHGIDINNISIEQKDNLYAKYTSKRTEKEPLIDKNGLFNKKIYDKNNNTVANFYVDEHGNKQGLHQSFHTTGELMLDVNYKNNNKHGIERTYDHVGNIISINCYFNGNIMDVLGDYGIDLRNITEKEMGLLVMMYD